MQLSNHTGYAKWTGQRLQGEHLDELVRGLESNQLLAYDYLMTGTAIGPGTALYAIRLTGGLWQGTLAPNRSCSRYYP